MRKEEAVEQDVVGLRRGRESGGKARATLSGLQIESARPRLRHASTRLNPTLPAADTKCPLLAPVALPLSRRVLEAVPLPLPIEVVIL